MSFPFACSSNGTPRVVMGRLCALRVDIESRDDNQVVIEFIVHGINEREFS